MVREHEQHSNPLWMWKWYFSISVSYKAPSIYNSIREKTVSMTTTLQGMSYCFLLKMNSFFWLHHILNIKLRVTEIMYSNINTYNYNNFHIPFFSRIVHEIYFCLTLVNSECSIYKQILRFFFLILVIK